MNRPERMIAFSRPRGESEIQQTRIHMGWQPSLADIGLRIKELSNPEVPPPVNLLSVPSPDLRRRWDDTLHEASGLIVATTVDMWQTVNQGLPLDEGVVAHIEVAADHDKPVFMQDGLYEYPDWPEASLFGTPTTEVFARAYDAGLLVVMESDVRKIEERIFGNE